MPPKKMEVKPDTAPPVFTVNLETSKGLVVVEVHRDWAPHGADHFYNLVMTGYFDGNRIYRVTQRYAQFGVNGDPKTTGLWSMARIPDDPREAQQSQRNAELRAGGRRHTHHAVILQFAGQ